MTPATIGIHIPQLGSSHQALLNECVQQLGAKASRNRLRRQYYDHKATLRDLGIAIPPALRSIEMVVGWPAKGVDSLSRRLNLDGFTSSGVSADDLGLTAILDDNRFDVEAPQAHTSALLTPPAFVTVTAGDVEAGEPPALITMRSGEWATGLWDGRRRLLRGGLTIISVDEDGVPNHLVLYAPDTAIICKKASTGGTWDVRESRHELGVPMEPLIFNPSLDRPFGRSRVTRSAMALTDSAVRTLVRSEVSAEFFNAPQRWALNVAEDAFEDSSGNPVPAWTSLIGRILAVTGDEETGLEPKVGQFPQQSMVPNFEQLRGIAAMFASDQNLPLDSLGIVHDNPSSAEAIERAKEELVLDAKSAIRTFRPAWNRTVRRVGQLLDDSPAAAVEFAKLTAHFENPATPSIVSASDAASKEMTAFPWMSDSPVMLERFGHDADEIKRLLADKSRAEARQLVGSLAQPPAGDAEVR